MELGKVQARGQVTLPRAIRKGADIKPGDLIGMKVTGPGRVELHVVARMTLAEVFERFRIEGPIDETADREAWQDVAARDVLGG
jgi:bifunctional DNA-binding transcriptional regulator/antitoxin component of YhaV-PrlF toxin-antitoxin module